MGFIFSSSEYTRGTPVGMFSSAIASSGMLSRYFTAMGGDGEGQTALC
jgi:hypothetical protein